MRTRQRQLNLLLAEGCSPELIALPQAAGKRRDPAASEVAVATGLFGREGGR
jgi:hypothetical protein